jgi:hypothetical protein
LKNHGKIEACQINIAAVDDEELTIEKLKERRFSSEATKENGRF